MAGKKDFIIIAFAVFLVGCTTHTAKNDADTVTPDGDDIATYGDDMLWTDADDILPSSCGTEPFLAKAVSAGWKQTCAIATNGSLWCWGENYFGKAGDQTLESILCPSQVGEDKDWETVSCGGTFSCAIKVDHTLWCWGSNYFGQLGFGTGTGDVQTYPSPLMVDKGNDWRLVSAGRIQVCALKSDGSLYCWGGNDYGQLGVGDYLNRNTPSLVEGNWETVAAGEGHTCGIKTDGTLWCWGWNLYGQLGIGEWGDGDVNPMAYFAPQQVGTNSNWEIVGRGWRHSCASKNNGQAWCWGDNFAGQLGIGLKSAINAPQSVITEWRWSSLNTGSSHTCAIEKDSAKLFCWGNNYRGILGVGGEEDASTPAPVVLDTQWSSFAMGTMFTCAIDENSFLYCWGWNENGQLGIGSIENSSVPTQINF